MQHTKIAIIGAGAVGSTTANALMLRNLATEIILVDINDLRCTGEMFDLSDTLSFSVSLNISMGSAQDARNADIIIFLAGIPQKPGQSRLDLFTTNKKVVQVIFKELQPINPDVIIIMVTNPIDRLTLLAQNINGLLRVQIFGTGTLLDSLRILGLIAHTLSVAEQSIDAYVLGKHGDSQFVAWSCAHIAGMPITLFSDMTKERLAALEQATRQKVLDIIDCKGATYYGIAACISLMCESIIFNQKRVLPLLTYHKNLNVYLSLSVVLGERGIEKVILLKLAVHEKVMLYQSAQCIKTL